MSVLDKISQIEKELQSEWEQEGFSIHDAILDHIEEVGFLVTHVLDVDLG